ATTDIYTLSLHDALPIYRHAHRLRLLDEQTLRRQHVLDLGGADAERERGERAVRARVRIAADNRHPRQRRPLLRSDHVHDALARSEEHTSELQSLAYLVC